AACEPEVVAVADLIRAMGGDIEGAGTPRIVIKGREQLGGAKVRVIGDRIEAGTYLLAAAATGGKVTASGINPAFFGRFLETLDQMGLSVEASADAITVSRGGAEIKPVRIATNPFPEVATDLQAPLMAALCIASGESVIEENVFEGRFGHVSELCRMG